MTTRRSRGDGGLHFDVSRQRWIATASLGYDPAGKRIIKRGSGKTKTEAKDKLKQVLRDSALVRSGCGTSVQYSVQVVARLDTSG